MTHSTGVDTGLPVAGVEATSVIEYPGEICAVLFVQGCNFRCPFCHNPQLVSRAAHSPAGDAPGAAVSHGRVVELLEKRRGVLDAVTLTGGEPLLYTSLPQYLAWIRSLGYKIKLDTNGSLPDRLAGVLETGLVDYVAMDIKSAPERYEEAAGVPADLNAIRESVDRIMGSGISYEFRSTILPRLHDWATVRKMARSIEGAERYFLQTFRPQSTLDPAYERERPFPTAEMEALAATARDYVLRCEVR